MCSEMEMNTQDLESLVDEFERKQEDQHKHSYDLSLDSILVIYYSLLR